MQNAFPVQGHQKLQLVFQCGDALAFGIALVQQLDHTGDGGGQLIQIHGFENVVESIGFQRFPQELHIRMTADEYDLNGGEFCVQLLCQCDAVHIGCDHIGDHQIHRILPDVIVGLGAVRKFRFYADTVFCPIEMFPQAASDGLFVVDDDGFVHTLPPVIRPERSEYQLKM